MATNDKYDRQLRLWGANGQRKLMSSNILLINADNVGTEALKNLVLPGIGSFTILDDFTVDQSDLGCNFFITPNTLGKPRAEVVTELLCELNPDVKGYARVANFENILQNDIAFFHSFDLILTANLLESQLMALAQYCWTEDIPMIILRSVGFLGTVRIQVKDHCIVELKDDSDPFDLRIANAFPKLRDHCLSLDLKSLDSMEHRHVPYVIILIQALEQWKQQHGGQGPVTTADKEGFKTLIKSMSRDFAQEMNFQEAVREAYRAFSPKTLSEETRSLLSTNTWDPTAIAAMVAATNSGTGNRHKREKLHFNVLVQTLRLYLLQSEGVLPLCGALPDMTSTTSHYMVLQQTYSSQHLLDTTAFTSLLHSLLHSLGLPPDSISTEEVALFVRHAPALRTLSTSSLHPGTSTPAEVETVQEVLRGGDLFDDTTQTPLLWYLTLLATERFHAKYARHPGTRPGPLSSTTSTTTSNTPWLQEEVARLYEEVLVVGLQQFQLPPGLFAPRPSTSTAATTTSATTSPMDTAEEVEQSGVLFTPGHALEVVRYGGKEVHSVGAVVGGVAAQEAVKLLTHQYGPLQSVYVFNGIAGCAAVYDL